MYVVYILVDGHKMFTGKKHKTKDSAIKEKESLERGGYTYNIEEVKDVNK